MGFFLESFDCSEALNPCTQDNVDAGNLYHPHCEDDKFVQCDEALNCYVQVRVFFIFKNIKIKKCIIVSSLKK